MSNTQRNSDISVVGAGLVGSLLSIYLSKHGFNIEMFERRPDMRKETLSAGRSINLAISTRGLRALREVGLEEETLKEAVPMRGRMIHSPAGELTFQRYGRDDSQYINSISRGALNKMLMTKAEESKLVSIHFNERCEGMDFDSGTLRLQNEKDKKQSRLVSNIVIGTDGSASAIRNDMQKLPGYQCREELLDYGYKELLITPDEKGGFKMEKNALHIWPRGTFMLIALPNFDGSFTCTLFLPFKGKLGFESLITPETVTAFFNEHFSDAVPLLDDLTGTFFGNPTGHMVTVKSNPWNVSGSALLLGDAAHAIVPFFGQGANAGFEDLTILDRCMEKYTASGGSLYLDRRAGRDAESHARRNSEGSSAWESIFDDFSSQRKIDTDAIADMAVENFIEMRDKVADPHFQLEKAVEKVLQKEFPTSYFSRYSLVTFSNVPYSFALRAGAVNDEVLQELCRGIDSAEQVDLEKAKKLLKSKVEPILSEQKEELFVSSK
ncbi:MAG TPA: NAD(P)/FAD-dependent oxidoreductase [Chroococcales cyanobacterium]